MTRLLLRHVHFRLALLHADEYMARLLLPHVHFGVALLHADEYKLTNTWLDSVRPCALRSSTSSRGRIQADEYMTRLLLGYIHFGLALLHTDEYKRTYT